MTVTEPCVSPSTGVLSPDMRVNYAYGMVLGLDEFVQEQLHRLTKDYLHERALHGFGTVSGLAVSVAPASGAPDFTVSVTTGVAVDQWGREIVIRCDQCARLGAWLAVQEQSSPGTVAQHLDAAGKLTVHVVASFAECEDALVPIPGQPCSSSGQPTAPSRIRDAWDVDLRWDRPAMARWDSDRRLARLLSTVSVVPGLPAADSSEQDIITAVLALRDRAGEGPGKLEVDPAAAGLPWKLPAETAAAALDRIFTTWVTQVRPALAPDVIEPDVASDPAILLSTITFTPAAPFDAANPVVTAADAPDDEGRPFLLATELIQELRWLSGSGTAPVPVDPPAVPDVEPQQLLTVAGRAAAPTVLDAWFHLGVPVHLPPVLTVVDETGESYDYLTSAFDSAGNPTDFSEVWTLTAPKRGIHDRDGLQVAVAVPLAGVQVGDPTVTLQQFADEQALTLLDEVGSAGQVTAYGIVRAAPARTETPQPDPVVPAQASAEFVDITVLENNEEQLLVELWFHPQPAGWVEDVRIESIRDFQVFSEHDPQEQVQVMQLGRASWCPNTWHARIRHPHPGRGIPVHLRFLFPTYYFVVETREGQMRLDEWIARNDLLFVGWDRHRADVVAFARSEPQRPEYKPFDSEVVRLKNKPPLENPPIVDRDDR